MHKQTYEYIQIKIIIIIVIINRQINNLTSMAFIKAIKIKFSLKSWYKNLSWNGLSTSGRLENVDLKVYKFINNKWILKKKSTNK